MRSALFLMVMLLIASSALAQGFGKNKVQYSDFNWRYLQSEHFDVYFADGQYRIAEFAAETAEQALLDIEDSWDYELEGRITFIIYSSHNKFQQTNVSSQQPEESVGGFTEFLKNRVVLPYTGNYEAFRHVIHHELTHAVNLRMFYGNGFQSILIGVATSNIPLWFTEGIAEYESRKGWDVDADMFMRDATITGYLPPVDYLNGYFAYKGGQSVFYYLDRKYGKEKVGEFVNKVKRTRDVPRSLKSSIGIDMEEFNQRWQNWLRKIYWPTIADMIPPTDFAEQLTDHREDRNYVNNGAAISPNGEQVVYLSDRSDYFDIWLFDLDKKKYHKLLRGQRTQDFEQLKWLDARISWSPDGNFITFASKAGPSDAINILDVKKKRVTEHLRFDLDGIFNPIWSPDGNKIAFVGMKAGQSDIFCYDLNSKQLVHVTDDVFSDDDPAWTKDSQGLIFSSDRRDSVMVFGYPPDFELWDLDYSTTNLYKITIGDKYAERLTNHEFNDRYPTVSPDGNVVIYVSDASGLNNLYRYDFETGKSEAITNTLTGCLLPSYSHIANRLVFTSFYEGGYDIYLLKNPDEMEPVEPDLTNFRMHGTPDPSVERVSAADIVTDPVNLNESTRQYSQYVFAREKITDNDLSEQALADTHTTRKPGGGFFSKKYRTKFTPDYVFATAAYNSFFGAQGSGQILFSDVLGDQLVLITTDLYYDFNNIDNSNFSVQYFYLPHRINYGFGLFRYVYYLDSGNIRDQTLQFQIDLAYPFSRYSRLELITRAFGVDRSEWLDFDDNQNRVSSYVKIGRRRIVQPELAYVHDTVIWGNTGPVNGARYRLSVAHSPNLQADRDTREIWNSEFTTVRGDVRHYIKLGRDYSWATRYTAGFSAGPDPQRFFLGGVSNWINRRFENNEVPTDEINDFYFSSFITPFRGGDYFEKRGMGNRFFLTNQEFRFPMIRYLILGWPLPIALQNVRGALFTDVGAAWFNDTFKFSERDRDEFGNHTGTRRLSDVQVAYGLGTRMNLGFFLLRWDVAWSTDGVDTSKPRYYFSLGAEY
ncbi:hypothetical protein KKH18_09145 [bacterium]|nr:hypothetical protein [bacterium]